MARENYETAQELAAKLSNLTAQYSETTKSGEKKGSAKGSFFERVFGKGGSARKGGTTHNDVLDLVNKLVEKTMASENTQTQYPKLAVIVKALQKYVNETNSKRLKGLVDDLVSDPQTQQTMGHYIPEGSDNFSQNINDISYAFLQTKDHVKYPYQGEVVEQPHTSDMSGLSDSSPTFHHGAGDNADLAKYQQYQINKQPINQCLKELQQVEQRANGLGHDDPNYLNHQEEAPGPDGPSGP